jgi:hypothetical protein
MMVPGMAIGINLFVSKRPLAAFGNSGGDAEMLQWTQAGDGARLMTLVHHDDAKREYAYGPGGGLPETSVGTFSDALMAQAKQNGWGSDQHGKRLEAHFPLRQVSRDVSGTKHPAL